MKTMVWLLGLLCACHRAADLAPPAPLPPTVAGSFADRVRNQLVHRIDDGHYEVDLMAMGLIAGAFGDEQSQKVWPHPRVAKPDAETCAALGIEPADVLVGAVDGTSETPPRMTFRIRRDGGIMVRTYVVRPSSVDTASLFAFSKPAGHAPVPTWNDLGAVMRLDDDDHFEISASACEKVLSNPLMLKRTARLMPWLHGAQVMGYRFYAIGPSSVVSQFGIANGDVIQRINGALPSLSSILALRGRKHMVVDLVRRGRPRTIDLVCGS